MIAVLKLQKYESTENRFHKHFKAMVHPKTLASPHHHHFVDFSDKCISMGLRMLWKPVLLKRHATASHFLPSGRSGLSKQSSEG